MKLTTALTALRVPTQLFLIQLARIAQLALCAMVAPRSGSRPTPWFIVEKSVPKVTTALKRHPKRSHAQLAHTMGTSELCLLHSVYSAQIILSTIRRGKKDAGHVELSLLPQKDPRPVSALETSEHSLMLILPAAA